MARDYDFIFTTEPPPQSSPSSPLTWLFYVAVLVLVGVTSFLVGVMYEQRTDTSQSAELNTFWETWDILEDSYYGDLPTVDDRKYGAINGLITSLNDPFTSFSPPEVATVRRQELDGHFGGIGIQVRDNDVQDVVVVAVIPGNPADEAGVQPEDIIYEVEGQSMRGMSTDFVAAQIRGEIGTPVTMVFYRPSDEKTYEVTMTRAIIETPTVYTENLDGIGYVSLSTFNGVASSQLQEGLENLLEQNPRGLILDLRANGGGLLDQAVNVADLFLPEGVILTERTSDGDEEVFSSDSGDLAEEIPLVILVDGGTASASEVVAGALQDRDRALLIGQQTFGKGVVQLVYNLTDGSQLRVTHAAWYTPDNRMISEAGLTPNQPILEAFSTSGEDMILEAALKYLNDTYPAEEDEAGIDPTEEPEATAEVTTTIEATVTPDSTEEATPTIEATDE